MKDFLRKIVEFIVEDNVPVEINEEEGENLTIYTIVVPEEEIGKVIGKGGKIISALRTLARLKAIREQKRILVKVGDQKGKGFSFPTVNDNESGDSASA